jgi:adenylate kinase
MRAADNLEKIESQIMSLPVSEQIHLIERIARRVRSVQTKSEIILNWNDLYGTGKGIWSGDDAQDYVNRAREERI